MTARDEWTETLKCRHCGREGMARLSANDDDPEGVRAEQIPYGFEFANSNFSCRDCGLPVEP